MGIFNRRCLSRNVEKPPFHLDRVNDTDKENDGIKGVVGSINRLRTKKLFLAILTRKGTLVFKSS
jgi:hypothetical protein